MEIEAALPPAKVRLNSNIRNYGIRALKLPISHPINQALRDTEDSAKLSILRISKPKPKPKTKVQLERILDAISDLHIDEDTLEPIQHFYFQPWNREVPYTVSISIRTKEEETLNHINTMYSEPRNTVYIYSDASGFDLPENSTIGVGLVVVDPTSYSPSPKVLYSEQHNIGDL